MVSRKTKLYGIVFVYAMLSLFAVSTASGAEGDNQGQGGIFDGGQTAVEPAAEELQVPKGQSVKVGSFGQIDLHVKDLDLTRVLQLLSIQSQRNIIASRNVAGTVSADLYGVDFYDALESILQPNGFGYREKGQFIYVYTAAEIQAIEDAERKLTHRVIRLDYLTAEDASVFVTPLLSSAGSISVSSVPVSGIQPSVGDAGENSFAYSDTMIVRDYPENVDEIVKVIDDLDVRPKQVLIEATILEAQLQEDNAFGVDFSILVDMSLSDFVRPLNVVDQLIGGSIEDTGEGLHSTVGNTQAGDAGFKFGVLDDDFAIFLRALDRVTDTTVVANPKLLVLNRQRADLLVGAKLGYLSTTATETATTQTVDFLEVGTQLSVRPFVSSDDFVRMELKPSISDGTTTAVEGVVIPNETTEEMTTNVIVRNGQTVVMGGLFKEDTTVTRNQVPGLGDMPFVGPAFKGVDDETSRSEVIFLIKPTVMKDDVLYEQGERASDNVELTRIGAREGLLPWSRSRLTTGHIRKAIEEHGNGNKTKALWWTNLALSLDPRSLEARRLKEQLTGDRIYWPTSSALIEAVNKTVDDQLQASVDRAENHAKQTELAKQAAKQARLDRIAARRAIKEARRAKRDEARARRIAAREQRKADRAAALAAVQEATTEPSEAELSDGNELAATETTGDEATVDQPSEEQTAQASDEAEEQTAQAGDEAADQVIEQVEEMELVEVEVDNSFSETVDAEATEVIEVIEVAETEQQPEAGADEFVATEEAPEGNTDDAEAGFEEVAAADEATESEESIEDAEQVATSIATEAEAAAAEAAVTEVAVDPSAASLESDDPDASMNEAIEASKGLQENPSLTSAADERAGEDDASDSSEEAVAEGSDEQESDSTVVAADEDPAGDESADAEQDEAQADAGDEGSSDEDASASTDSEGEGEAGSETATVDVLEAVEQWTE